jgi:proteasome accessory factor C
VPTGEQAPYVGEGAKLPEPGRWFDDADVDRVVLRLAPAGAWVVETYPVDEVVELADGTGRVDVRLPVTGVGWLERLLLRLGPAGDVVAPESWHDVGARAAARVLAAYGDS